MKSFLAMTMCVIVAASSTLLGGCGAPKAQVDWMAPLANLDPPSPERNSVYVQYRDASGGELELRNELRGAVSKAGYLIEQNPDRAAYRLEAIVRKFGVEEGDDEGTSWRSGLDPIGALTRTVRYAMVIDIVLAQRYREGVQVNVNNSSNDVSGSRLKDQIGNVEFVGGNYVDIQVNQDLNTIKEHLSFKNALIARTSGVRMSEAGALDALRPRLTRAITNALSPAN